jgi:chromosome partitioning protein
MTGVRPHLDLLPSNPGLAGAEVELIGLRRREYRLRDALESAAGVHRVTIIDCPPSLGLLTVNALAAAGDVVIPIQCEYLALEGLMQLINTIDLIKRRLNPSLNLLGVVMTMFDARTRLSSQVAQDVQRFFPSRTFQSVIPRAVRLAEAPSYGQSIFEYDPSSRAARAYSSLGDELAGRLGLATHENGQVISGNGATAPSAEPGTTIGNPDTEERHPTDPRIDAETLAQGHTG